MSPKCLLNRKWVCALKFVQSSILVLSIASLLSCPKSPMSSLFPFQSFLILSYLDTQSIHHTSSYYFSLPLHSGLKLSVSLGLLLLMTYSSFCWTHSHFLHQQLILKAFWGKGERLQQATVFSGLRFIFSSAKSHAFHVSSSPARMLDIHQGSWHYSIVLPFL